MSPIQSALTVYVFYFSLFALLLSALYPLFPGRIGYGALYVAVLVGGAPAVWLATRIRGGEPCAVLPEILAEALAPFQILFFLFCLSF